MRAGDDSPPRATRAIMAGLNLVIISAMPLPVPLLDEQFAFQETVEAIVRLGARHEVSLAELDVLFGSLQRRAFPSKL